MATWLCKGYNLITTQYSGGGEGVDEHDGQDMNDVLNLKLILNQLEIVDITKIGMYGHSRGGLMTYMCLSQVNRIKTAVAGAAPSDMRKQIEERSDLKIKTATMFDHVGIREIDKRSAIKWAEKFCQTTPLLLVHGTYDSQVLVSHSLELATELYKNKKFFRLMLLEGGNHSLTNFERLYQESVKNWFDRYLKQDQPLPNLEIKDHFYSTVS